MPRQRPARRSADYSVYDSPQVSLVESIRRATQQPRRRSWKPYAKGEDAGSSRPSNSAAPILPTRMPELASPSAQLKSYLQAAEIARECHTNPPRQIYQPQPMYPCERTVANDQEWCMTPQFSMSPATSVDSQPLLDSPASTSLPWAPFIASPDPHLLQQDSRVGYISSYSNLFDFRDSQPSECMDASGVASSATSEEMAEKHICFDESTPLSPLAELGVKPYGTAEDLDTFVSLLTWEVVAEGTLLEF